MCKLSAKSSSWSLSLVRRWDEPRLSELQPTAFRLSIVRPCSTDRRVVMWSIWCWKMQSVSRIVLVYQKVFFFFFKGVERMRGRISGHFWRGIMIVRSGSARVCHHPYHYREHTWTVGLDCSILCLVWHANTWLVLGFPLYSYYFKVYVFYFW